MESRLLLDVIILKSSSIFELLTSEDKSLLIWGNSFLVLDLGLHVLNSIWLFNIESDGLSGKGLHEDLHTTSKSEDEMESWLLLDVVILEGTSVFELFTSEDKSLLVRRDTFFVLDLGFDVLNRVRWFDIKSNSFTS